MEKAQAGKESQLSAVIEEIYRSTQHFDIGCSQLGCFLCAKGGKRSEECQRINEAVVLLPTENTLIKKLNSAGFPEISVNGFNIGFLAPDQDCPFNKNGFCGIHGKHPIDCRSFPIIPSINERGDLIISISLMCPTVPPWDFVKTWVENWKRLWELLPEEWFRFYSKVPTNPVKPIAMIVKKP
jgi:Fe-S-cluster containining protein